MDSDRFDRRKLMIVADMTRGLAVGSIGVVSITDHMTLPILVVLVGLYGFGQALFYPAQAWLWATLLSAATALLMFVGRFEVRGPFVVKFQLDGSAGHR